MVSCRINSPAFKAFLITCPKDEQLANLLITEFTCMNGMTIEGLKSIYSYQEFPDNGLDDQGYVGARLLIQYGNGWQCGVKAKCKLGGDADLVPLKVVHWTGWIVNENNAK